MKVYVAASSAEIERAEAAIASLRDLGIQVTSTWPAVVRSVGVSNPRGASRADRRAWSETDLLELAAAEHLWLLAPGPESPTRGAWVELGYARAAGLVIVSSGDTLQSIFPALGLEFATDADALNYFAKRVGRGEPSTVRM